MGSAKRYDNIKIGFARFFYEFVIIFLNDSNKCKSSSLDMSVLKVEFHDDKIVTYRKWKIIRWAFSRFARFGEKNCGGGCEAQMAGEQI